MLPTWTSKTACHACSEKSHHNWNVGGCRWFPDIEVEAVFTHVRVRVPHIHEFRFERGVDCLVAGRRQIRGVVRNLRRVVGLRQRLRWSEAQVADGRPGERDAEEAVNVLLAEAVHLPEVGDVDMLRCSFTTPHRYVHTFH